MGIRHPDAVGCARLLAPSGSELLAATSDVWDDLDAVPIELDESGVYTLEVAGDGGSTPLYSFVVWDVPPPSVQMIFPGPAGMVRNSDGAADRHG